jgi:hypothetical protein
VRSGPWFEVNVTSAGDVLGMDVETAGGWGREEGSATGALRVEFA